MTISVVDNRICSVGISHGTPNRYPPLDPCSSSLQLADRESIAERVGWQPPPTWKSGVGQLATTAYLVQQSGTAYLVHYAARQLRVGAGTRSQHLYSWLRL